MTKKLKYLNDCPKKLHGLASNRWGGNQLQRLRGFRGATYGPASKARRLTKEEREQIEAQLRDQGVLADLKARPSFDLAESANRESGTIDSIPPTKKNRPSAESLGSVDK